MNTRLAILIALLTLFVCPPSQSSAEPHDAITTVMLRSTVRLTSDHREIKLADLATTSGPQAAKLQNLTVTLDKPVVAGQWTPFTLESIRLLIDQAPDIHAGSVILAGSNGSITRRTDTDPLTKPLNNNNLNQHKQSGPVLRHHLQSWIYARLKTDEPSTRIKFNDSDLSLLNTPTTGRIVEINEIGRSTKMSCRVVIYENEQIVASDTVRFEVQIQRQVRITTAQIRRRSPINDELTTIETRWLSPVMPIADPETSLGQVCKKTIDPGSIVLDSMLESPLLIERGETISVKSITGSVSVGILARAMSDGRLGELIEIESRDRTQRFTARVAGPGRAVIIQSPQKTRKDPNERS